MGDPSARCSPHGCEGRSNREPVNGGPSGFRVFHLVVRATQREHCILTKPSRNRIAATLLSEFGAAWTACATCRSVLNASRPTWTCNRFYLQTVLEGTDTLQNRKAREKILAGLFGSLFEKKDP